MLRTALFPLTILLLGVTAGPGSTKTGERDRATLLQQSGHPQAMTEYGDWPYVYLAKEEFIDLHADETSMRKRDVILVVSPEGREVATRRIVLHKSSKLREIECGTVALNGLWLPLQGGKPLEKKVGDFVEYTFILESVVKGSICVFDYTVKYDFALGYEEFPMGSEVPVLHARFCVKDDDLVNPSVFIRNQTDALEVTRTTEGEPGPGDKGQCMFDVRNVPPDCRDPLVPPMEEYQPIGTMYMAGRLNWNDMVLAEGSYLFAACDLSDVGEARKLVKRILADDPRMGEVIARVLEFVRTEFQVFPYAGWDLFPTPAEYTFEKRMGSVNDVCGVAIGLMHMAGVPLQLGLVRALSRGSWYGTAYNALQFDRLLPVVTLGNGRMWVDPMCRECGVGDLDWSLAGATGLLFKADIRKDLESFDEAAFEAFRDGSMRDARRVFFGKLVNARWTDIVPVTESPEWRDSPETREVTRIHFTPEGHLRARAHAQFVGQAKIDLRRDLQDAPDSEREEWITSYLVRRHPQARLLQAPEFEGIEPDLRVFASQDTLHVHVEFEIPDFLLPGVPAMLPGQLLLPAVRSPLPEPRERAAPLWLSYSRCSLHEVFLELPPGVALEEDPQPFSLNGKTVRYRSSASRDGGMLHFQRFMMTRCATLPPEDAARLHEEYSRIAAHESRPVRFLATAGK